MIYTSRYSNKQLRQPGYYPVGISVGKPKFELGYVLRDQCYILAPRYNMLQMEQGEYRTAYMAKLNESPQKVIGVVRRLEAAAKAEGKPLVLLCFEDVRIPSDWCHRRLFAEWWKEHTGEVINELPNPDPPKIKKPTTVKSTATPITISAKAADLVPEPAQAVFEQLSLFPA